VLIPVFPLAGPLINLVLGRRLERLFGRWIIHSVAIAAVVASFGLAAYMVFGPLMQAFHAEQGGFGISQVVYTWIEAGRRSTVWTRQARLAARLAPLSGRDRRGWRLDWLRCLDTTGAAGGSTGSAAWTQQARLAARLAPVPGHDRRG
jgi:hypothetical protein